MSFHNTQKSYKKTIQKKGEGERERKIENYPKKGGGRERNKNRKPSKERGTERKKQKQNGESYSHKHEEGKDQYLPLQ